MCAVGVVRILLLLMCGGGGGGGVEQSHQKDHG